MNASIGVTTGANGGSVTGGNGGHSGDWNINWSSKGGNGDIGSAIDLDAIKGQLNGALNGVGSQLDGHSGSWTYNYTTGNTGKTGTGLDLSGIKDQLTGALNGALSGTEGKNGQSSGNTGDSSWTYNWSSDGKSGSGSSGANNGVGLDLNGIKSQVSGALNGALSGSQTTGGAGFDLSKIIGNAVSGQSGQQSGSTGKGGQWSAQWSSNGAGVDANQLGGLLSDMQSKLNGALSANSGVTINTGVNKGAIGTGTNKIGSTGDSYTYNYSVTPVPAVRVL